MAMRTKTVEYAFPINAASTASGTRLNFTTITLTIPETTSRTFLSCEIDCMVEGNSTSGTEVTARLLGLSLAGATANDQTITFTYNQASTAQSTYHFSRDVTSVFNSGFGAGTTCTAQVGVTVTGPAVHNQTAKLIITYEYDDASQDTRVKTVRIPLDSKTSGLTTTAAAIGSMQIPNLSTFCPEASKTFLRMWVEFEGNNGVLANTSSTISFKIDSGGTATTTNASSHSASATNNYVRYLFDCSTMSTTATHDVYLNTSTTNVAFPGASLVLYVTYTYSHNSSSSVLNSLMMAISDGHGRPGVDSTNPQRFALPFTVPEASPTLVQSGVKFFGGDAEMTEWFMRAGSQSYREYTFSSGQIGDCGLTAVSWRIDSGGAQGSGFSIAQGANVFTLDTYSGAPTDDDSVGCLTCPVLLLNYTSDIDATLGEDAHLHTILWSNRDGCLAVSDDVTLEWTPTSAPTPADANYWITNLTWHGFYAPDTSSLGWTVYTYAQVLSTENYNGASGPAWMSVQNQTPVYCFGGESLFEVPTNMTALFRTWPSDTSKPDATQNRKWRNNSTNNFVHSFGSRIYVTYQALARTESGNVSNYTGDGSGIEVDLYSSTSKKFLASTTTTTGGAFSFAVPAGDTYFAVARQDSTHVGRSDNLAVS